MISNADKNNIIARVGSLFKRQVPTATPTAPVQILNGFSNGNLSPSEQEAIKNSPFFVGNAKGNQVIAPNALNDSVRSLSPDHSFTSQTGSASDPVRSLSPDHSFTSQTGSATSHLNDTTSHSPVAVDIKPTAENTLPWNYAMDTLHTNISNPQVLSKLTDNSAGIKFNGNGLSGGKGAIDSVTINGHTYTDLGHINGAIKHVLDENHSNTNASTTISAQREDQVLAMHAGRTSGSNTADPVHSGAASPSTLREDQVLAMHAGRTSGSNTADPVRSGAGTTPAPSMSPSQAMQAERSVFSSATPNSSPSQAMQAERTMGSNVSDSVRSGTGTAPSAASVNSEINTLNQERNLMGNSVSDSVRSGAGTTPASSTSPSQAMQAERTGSVFPPTSTFAVPAPQVSSNPNGVVGNSPISADIKESGWGGRPALDPVNPIIEARSQTQSSIAKVEAQHPGHL